MADLRIDLAAEFRGKKAFKDANKSVTNLERSVKKLAAAFGIGLSVQQVVAFGKASVKAFMDDEKSAKRLALSVKNLGLAMSQPAIDQYIAGLEKSASIADDQLRPAFQLLLTTTGSLSKSQEILTTAIEASRGSGIELETVARDLGNAYVGNTKGLKKYALGLTQAELKTMSFTKIQEKFNKQFQGANAAYLGTYAGKLDTLNVASQNAQEIIGKGLVDALIAAGGEGANIQHITDSMTELATATAEVTRGVGKLIGYWQKLDQVTSTGFIGQLRKLTDLITPAGFIKTGLNAFRNLGKENPVARTGAAGAAGAMAAQRREKALTEKRARDQLKATRALTAEQKKQAALKKAGTVFDLEQIQLVAALKGKLSEEEKIRVEAQLALLNGNVKVAQELTAQILQAQDSSGNLAKFLATLPDARNPFQYLDAYLSYLGNKAAAISAGTPFGQAAPSTNGGGNTTAAPIPAMPTTSAPDFFATLAAQGAGASGGFSPVVAAAMAAGGGGTTVVNVYNAGSVISQAELIDSIVDATQVRSLSGSPSQIGRIQGMFSI